MPKTILKLHENGDFETVGVQLTQDGNAYSFTENAITVPKIIKYPPVGYQNYFIEKTTTSGYIANADGLKPADEGDRVSDFINIGGWGNAVICYRFRNVHGGYRAWTAIVFYDANKQYTVTQYDNYLSSTGQTGDFIMSVVVPSNYTYMRVAVNYYDDHVTPVKVSVEKGTVATEKHYLAPEDMPEWVVDTGNPISIFPQGIVIKGDLI